MKRIIATTLLALGLSAPAFAEYTFVVPQKPGGGTTVWAEIVAKELEPFLGEKITIKTIPGARDIPGFNEFHNELRYDDKTVMVSHGGNGVSFLQEEVDYDYREYESVALQNLNIIVGKLKDADMDRPVFAAGSGMVPEAFAMTMLACGPMPNTEAYIACFRDRVTWVNGMSTAERRLAFKRGELTGTRENPAAYKKHVESNPDAELWFHHGLLKLDGSHADDPNYPGYQFETLFEQRWGVAPSGEFYDAYKLVKSFRDGLQKALWVNKNNPNRQKLVDAITAMTKDETAMNNLRSKVGDYEWIVGDDGNAHRDTLTTFITKEALQNLVEFNTKALGLASVYKENLVR